LVGMAKNYEDQIPKRIPAHVPEVVAGTLQEAIDRFNVGRSPIELTPRQEQILAVVAAAAPVTISVLARELGITKPGASLAVSSLASKGLLAKTPGLRDRREVCVELTAVGRRAHSRCAVVDPEAIDQVLKGMTRSQLATLAGTFRKARSALRNERR
jgi:DNA-binding MarR family transcriptional regulator